MSVKLLNLEDASVWASEFLGKDISLSNISYLIRCGKISKHYAKNGVLSVSKNELESYYKASKQEKNEL